MDAREAIELARERWSCRGDGVPMRVRAYLATPLACDDVTRVQSLDSALEWAALCDVAGPPSDLAWPRGETALLPSPLASTTRAGWDVACCSRARVGATREDVRSRRRRPHPELYGPGRIMTNGGPFKALDIPLLTLVTDHIEWHVRGDEERIRALLTRLHCLGRGSGSDLGSVDYWTVERVERDESIERDGMPARAVPVESCERAIERYGDAVEIEEVAVRGPYWHRLNRTLAALPPC